MEVDIEDIVKQIKYTDSQKSVSTSNAYSQDFTDSGSDKNQSSGKETYVIDQIDSDSDKLYPLHSDENILNFSSSHHTGYEKENKIKENRNSHDQSIFVENTFTQTSKTIFGLKNEVSIQNTVELQHFETQTSFVTITERANEKNILIIKDVCDGKKHMQHLNESDGTIIKTLYNCEDISSLRRGSEIDYESNSNDNFDHEENLITLKSSGEYYDDTADGSTDDVESWNVNSDIEEDSLMRDESNKNKIDYSSDVDTDALESVEDDVVELYQTLANVSKPHTIAFPDSAICDVSVLTSVTEETNINNSIIDVSQGFYSSNNMQHFKDPHRAARSKFRIQSLFTNSDTNENDKNNLKLPPIYANPSYPSSPLINTLFSVNTQQTQFQCHNPFPGMIQGQQRISDRMEYVSKSRASGESALAYMNQDPKENSGHVQLPPIFSFNMFYNKYNKGETIFSNNEQHVHSQDIGSEEINISERIQDLKLSKCVKRTKSPSECSSGELKDSDVTGKGCDALCSDIMRRLQSNIWQEIAETLSYLPKSLESFWSVMSEMRTADLLRLIVSLVESPRTQVARAACEAVAQVLKHTNFVKKPDFYEAMGILLAKTNSYNRVVRRAANLALDEVVCSLHYTHCIAAICVSGVEHKSPLVRCASSRLLIVCCALAEGGRRLLRCRPPSAASARRHVLQAMAVLLQDKNLETRKYAERLYAILRPLPNFEAYFLTDVDAELATEHMKKYDHLLNIKNTR